MRVFVSLPMNGKAIAEINEDLDRIVNKVMNVEPFLDAEFVTAYTTIEPGEGVKHDRVWYLGRAIQILSICDAVIFSKDWVKANGCKMEKRIAETYNIPIYKETHERTLWPQPQD